MCYNNNNNNHNNFDGNTNDHYLQRIFPPWVKFASQLSKGCSSNCFPKWVRGCQLAQPFHLSKATWHSFTPSCLSLVSCNLPPPFCHYLPLQWKSLLPAIPLPNTLSKNHLILCTSTINSMLFAPSTKNQFRPSL